MKKKLALLCILTILAQLLAPFGTMISRAATSVSNVEHLGEIYQEQASPAVTYSMNIDWKYKRAEDGAIFPLAVATAGMEKDGKQFYEMGYDDSDWETVSVPHAVNAEDSFDGFGVDAGEGSLYRGFLFYRKIITIPKSDEGKKFLLEFEAFRQSVYVYVNGEMVGYNEAGVTAVGFDITDYIVAGEENLIAVATENTSARGSYVSTQETIPGHEPGDLSGVAYQWNTMDYNTVQGGLTGNVNLYAKRMIYQTLPLYSNLKTTGNYIYGSNFDFYENSADITVRAEIRNETKETKNITLQVDVVDRGGMLVASFAETASVTPATDTDSARFLTMVPDTAYDAEGNGVETGVVDFGTVDVTYIEATQNVEDLYFWSDKNPYLYTVHTYLKEGDTIVDHQEMTTGFREVTYDKDRGLMMNGEPTYLKGYAQSSTNEWAVIGVANDWLAEMDMQLVKESNANYIRWMHIAPNPVDIRAGDKYGVISVCPAGDKDTEATGRNWDQRLEAMRDTIIYFRNSPSILFWEAGNNAISGEHMKQMTDLRKALDPGGNRFMGCRSLSSAEQIKEAEWVGTMINRRDALAYEAMKETGNYIPMLETEYHRNEAPRRVWDDYSPVDYDYVNKYLGAGAAAIDGYDIWDQTQEDFSLSMLSSWDGYSYFYNNRVGGTDKNYYSGAAMLLWSDSNMHARNGATENCRTSGRVDAVRIKKESYYAIQAAQSDEPAIDILGHWNYPSYIEGDTENGNYWYEDKSYNGFYWEGNGTYLQRNPTEKTVYVIGSADVSKVELYVNDKLVGTDASPTDDFIYAFDGIDVTQSGRVSAKAYDDRGKMIAEDEIKTAGEAATIRLTPVSGPEGWLADGSDIVYVDVEVVDAEGNVCPLDERKISFTVSDSSKTEFLGGYNSGTGDRIVNYKDYVYAECGVNRVFLRATREAGSVTLTATAEGMQPVSITLESFPIELKGGLYTEPKYSIEPPETVALQSLAEPFIADFIEGSGNIKMAGDVEDKDYEVSGAEVSSTEFSSTDKALNPDAGSVDTVYEYDTIGVYNNCNSLDGVTVKTGTLTLSEDTSPDGTRYIINTTGNAACFEGIEANYRTDILWEADIRFDEEGSGIVPWEEGDRRFGTYICRHDNYLAIQVGASSYLKYMEIDPEKWYHIAFISYFTYGFPKMEMLVYEYSGSEKIYLNTIPIVEQRSDPRIPNHLHIASGTSVDNMRMVLLGADALSITADTDNIKNGNALQLSYSATRQGVLVSNPAVTWSVYNGEDTEELKDENITINEKGVLNVGMNAAAQTVTVRATTDSGIYASTKITIIPSDIFAITSLGMNEDMTEIVNLEVIMNFYYADEVTFVTAVFDENGAMKAISTRTMYGDALRVGANTVPIEMELPEDFDQTKDTIKVFAVTKLSTGDAAVAEEGTSLAINEGSMIITAPAFDAASEIVVLVLDRNADDTDVKDSDILYYNQIKAEEISNAIPVGDLEACIAKIGGKVNGASTVKAALLGEADSDKEPVDEPKELPFTDVETNPDSKEYWMYAGINYVYQHDIMTGKTKTTFDPSGNLTRAEFAQTLYATGGKPTVEYTEIFNDVPAGEWYTSAVLWAYNNEVVSGIGEGKFDTGNDITREQIALMLYKYDTKVKGQSDSVDETCIDGFVDKGEVSDWAETAIKWAVTNGIMAGKAGNELDPTGTATRAESATMLAAYCKKDID